MSLPSFESVAELLMKDEYFAAIFHRAQTEQLLRTRGWMGAVQIPCTANWVADACPSFGVLDPETDELVHPDPRDEFQEHISNLTRTEKLAVVPYLRRLGYCVRVHPADRQSASFDICLPGWAVTRREKLRIQRLDFGEVLYATSPVMMYFRGFLCVLRLAPRLKAWLRRARFELVHQHWAPPNGPGYLQLLDKYSEGMGASKRARCD